MTITQSSSVDRVLITLSPDGTLRGAQQERLRMIRDDDTVISAAYEPAEALDAQALAAVLPDSAVLLAQVAALQASLTAAEQDRDAAVAERDQLRAQLGMQPASAVPAISDRQFASELRHRGIITLDESLAYLGRGAIPAALQALLNQIDDSVVRNDTLELLTGATLFVRAHPATDAIGAAFGWTPNQIDEFFLAAAQR